MKKYFALLSLALLPTATVFANEAAVEDLRSAEDLAMEMNLPVDSISSGLSNDEAAVDAQDSHGSHGGHGSHGRQVTCFARNRRGQRFSATDRFPDRAQARAMEQCYRAYSRWCFEEGCRWY